MQAALIRSIDSNYDPRALAISRALEDSGFHHVILDWSMSNNSSNVISYRRDRTIGNGFKSIINYLKFNFWVFWQLRRISPSLVVSIDGECFIGAYVYLLICSNQNRKIKIVLDVADSVAQKVSQSRLKCLVEFYETKIYRLSDYVVFPSKARVPLKSRQNFRVITNNFIDSDQVINFFNNKKRQGVIFYGGLLLPDRGLDKLLELSKNPKFKIEIAGYGELEEFIQGFVQENPRIVFHGQLSFEKISEIRSKSQFSWCWYEQNAIGNVNHASGKILESILLGSTPVTNLPDANLTFLMEHEMSRILYVSEVNYESKLVEGLKQIPQDRIVACPQSTQDGYFVLLKEIYE